MFFSLKYGDGEDMSLFFDLETNESENPQEQIQENPATLIWQNLFFPTRILLQGSLGDSFSSCSATRVQKCLLEERKLVYRVPIHHLLITKSTECSVVNSHSQGITNSSQGENTNDSEVPQISPVC